MGIRTLLLLSCQNEQIPLYQIVILCLGGKEGYVPFLSMPYTFAGKCFFPIIGWMCTSTLLYPPRNSRSWHENGAIFPCSVFQPCKKSSSSFPSRGEFLAKNSPGWQKVLSLHSFVVLLDLKPFCPGNNTLQSYFMLLLSTVLSPALRIIGRHFNTREPVAAVNLSLM